MAEALIAVLIEQLASVTVDSLTKEVRLLKNAEKDVEKLNSNLEAIQAVLEDAEKKQLTDRSVKLWLDKLNEASFQMDNVLDEWNTALLKLNIRGDGAVKVCSSIPSPFSCCGDKAKRFALRRDIDRKIKHLNRTLAEIASEKDQYRFNTTFAEKPLDRPRTTSLVDETEVEGRDEDKEILVSKLLRDNSVQQDQALGIIPIVGMGGLGKTTLVQLAFNDERVRTHFHLRIWVCVSDPFEEITVAKAIIEGVEGRSPDINELEGLSRRIAECIEGKMFLLILDDVWTKDSKKWNPFKQLVKRGSVGSRVVVTTRNEDVAKMMGATSQIIRLEKLSQEHCWLVFKKIAFLERSEKECKELEEIGRRIANKCKGLPLAAKSLGSLMSFKQTETQWEDVLYSELWMLENVEETFTPFLISYYDLSAREKRCFSYCATYPKDYRIKRERLIEMWMSQKYFGDATSSEDEGRKCFDNLVRRSFFQNFERDELNGSITFCKMHDVVHDFAQFMMQNKCLAVKVHNLEEEMSKSYIKKPRHLTIMVESDATFPTQDFLEINKKTLQTLFIVRNFFRIGHVNCSIFLQLTCLRSLTLSRCDIRILPTSIGGLIHLRYLDLSHNSIMMELPRSLCELCNLQSLNLSYCEQLRRLPEGIGKLANLRYLYISGSWWLKGIPKGLGKLTDLQSLDSLHVVEDKDVYFDIRDLKKFRNLQLRGTLDIIECQNLGSRDDAEKVGLKNISRNVDRLLLHFGSPREEIVREVDRAVLEGLEPPPKLLYLKISEYMSTTLSPSWIPCLNNLRIIEIALCRKCEVIPCLGNLSSLESISFSYMASVENVGLEFLGITESSSSTTIFPKLKYLSFYKMPRWQKWKGKVVNDAIRIMPCLKALQICYCPDLRRLPDFLKTITSLEKVNIYPSDSFKMQLPQHEWDKIFHSPHIQLSEYPNERFEKD